MKKMIRDGFRNVIQNAQNLGLEVILKRVNRNVMLYCESSVSSETQSMKPNQRVGVDML